MRLMKLALVLTAGALLVGPAMAQPPPYRPIGGYAGGPLAGMVGQSKQVQEELKMSKEQVESSCVWKASGRGGRVARAAQEASAAAAPVAASAVPLSPGKSSRRASRTS